MTSSSVRRPTPPAHTLPRVRHVQAGNELDEFEAHQFLEKFENTLTVKEMRAALKEIDLDFNKHVSLTEFLIYRYKADVHAVVNAAQGANSEAQKKIDAAQALCDKALSDMQKSQEAAEKALEAQKEMEAKEAEAKAAADELEKQQKAFDDQVAALEAKSTDSSLGIVKRNRAKNELAQLKASDPLPLRRAKITQDAAVRKCAKATKAAKKAADEAKAAAELAEKSYNEATAKLEEIKEQCKGTGDGQIWWMGRELEEKKKYMSQKQIARLEAKMAAEKAKAAEEAEGAGAAAAAAAGGD